MAKSAREDQANRRRIRDIGSKDDVLPLGKLKDLLVLWQQRLASGAFAPDTCKNMIKLYTIRIRRVEGADHGRTQT